MKMSNGELMRRIIHGNATAAQLREYADRVTAISTAEPCKHGHFGCALIDGGPCLDESLHHADELDPGADEQGATP